MTAQANGRRITRGDLEAAFAKVVGDGQEAAGRALPQALVVAGAVALVGLTLAYAAGRRRGRRTSSVVEIRRI